MLYRLVNKEYDALVEITCTVKEMENLINEFKLSDKNTRITQSPAMFVEWVNVHKLYVAKLKDKPILFDF